MAHEDDTRKTDPAKFVIQEMTGIEKELDALQEGDNEGFREISDRTLVAADRALTAIYEFSKASFHDDEEKFLEEMRRRREENAKLQPVKVWRFENAPEELRKLSEHGGYEDWIALIPDANEEALWWAETGTPFGCCEVTEHKIDGYTVRIGAHS